MTYLPGEAPQYENLTAKRATQPLFETSEWDFATLRRTYEAIEEVALEDLELDVYPNQVEVISTEQMLDAYSSIGMPLMYKHWSFGKHFARDEAMYRKGITGLAYEIVINSNPCISYNMEDNTMTMQALVMAHAAFGHNHFFKNNYLFKQWTDAEGILDYLQFAKNYILGCEERHGFAAVEETLDAAHALMDQGVFRYQRRKKHLDEEKQRQRERMEHAERTFNDLWRTVPGQAEAVEPSDLECSIAERKRKLQLPEENLLYFIEKKSPSLATWQRELLRIVRNIAQYFYPQKQTKVMNEGCATFVHHHIMNALYDKKLLTDGAMLEFNHMHANVLSQPDFDDPRFGGINPYALGFAMMTDIKRICLEPTDEDREWFPDFAGSGDWRAVLRDAWANYRDESFIQQFLSPHLMREMHLFALMDKEGDSHYTVTAIHDDRGYKRLRESLARTYDIGYVEPNIQVVDVDLLAERHLMLRHNMHDQVPLSEKSRDAVLQHLRMLWGYDVVITGVDAETDEVLYEASTVDKKDAG
jgi:spore cortex formation protein SpoVR/YcgB (stage V sporulation)